MIEDSRFRDTIFSHHGCTVHYGDMMIYVVGAVPVVFSWIHVTKRVPFHISKLLSKQAHHDGLHLVQHEGNLKQGCV